MLYGPCSNVIEANCLESASESVYFFLMATFSTLSRNSCSLLSKKRKQKRQEEIKFGVDAKTEVLKALVDNEPEAVAAIALFHNNY